MDRLSLIRNRKSCRAFLNQAVEKEIVLHLLEATKWAPSGVNHQPTQVAVLGPKTRAQLSIRLLEQFDAGITPNPDYTFCPDSWPDSYKARRKACGKLLYDSLGISPMDGEGKRRHKRRNYTFFEAPVGLIFYLEEGMPKGSWLDAGLFLQSFLLAAEALGLATCPQASLAEYPDIVRQVLGLKRVEIICGVALGYADVAHPLNSYRTDREPLQAFTQWYE